MNPYYEKDGVTIFRGEALQTLIALEGRERFTMLATDPPYSSGGAFRGDRMQSIDTKYVTSGQLEARPTYGGDNRDQRSFFAWCSLWLGAAYPLAAPGALVAVFSDWRQLPTMTDAVQAGGFIWRGIVPWDKTEASRPRLGGFRAQCEFVTWGSAGPMRDEGICGTGLWRGAAPRGDRLHQAEKPLELMTALLRVVPRGGVVLDPFCGSGTTLVAARDLGLRAIGIEMDEAHCETAVKRLAQGVLDLQPVSAAGA